MVTIFSAPKPFRGHIEVIQRNAIMSWARLMPDPDILLFGQDAGIAEVVKEFGLRHIPNVACNDFGTPLVSDLFAQAQKLAKYGLLCYVNADIILMSDFAEAVRRVETKWPKFLMIGQRWDIPLDAALNFDDNWEGNLKTWSKAHGSLHLPTGIDYFLFRPGLWEALPNFAVGRIGYDNWLVYEARHKGVPVIDATAMVMALHQNHDYSHLPGGASGIESGVEAKKNLALVGGLEHVFTIEDANWLLTANGVLPALTRQHLQLRLRHWFTERTTLRAIIRWIRRRLRLI